MSRKIETKWDYPDPDQPWWDGCELPEEGKFYDTGKLGDPDGWMSGDGMDSEDAEFSGPTLLLYDSEEWFCEDGGYCPESVLWRPFWCSDRLAAALLS